MNCPVCGRRTIFPKEAARPRCPSCGWGAEPVDPWKVRRFSEEVVLVTEASLANLIGALLIGGGIVAVAAYVVFGLCEVAPSVLYILLFACGVVAYACVGWYVARPRTLRPFGMLGRAGWLSPVMAVTWRLAYVWLMLYPGRLIALAAVGVHRYVAARRRLSELRGETGRREL
jgi:hypothetical protein